jgi:SAM-dependent methyltransferase
MNSENYWNQRWMDAQTGWDIGQASPPICAFADQWTAKDAPVLIPGCGNAHEAGYLLKTGFTNITLVDISAHLVAQLQETFQPQKDPRIRILHEDFFAHRGTYQLILEQTFFCAIDPKLRPDYIQQMHRLLLPGGTLAGVLFNRSFDGGPPFSGSIAEYKPKFEKWFDLQTLAPCYNSIPARKNNEAFLIATKPAAY